MFELFFEDKAFVLLEIQEDKIKEKQLSAPWTALAITPGRASIPIECDSNSHLENRKEEKRQWKQDGKEIKFKAFF